MSHKRPILQYRYANFDRSGVLSTPSPRRYLKLPAVSDLDPRADVTRGSRTVPATAPQTRREASLRVLLLSAKLKSTAAGEDPVSNLSPVAVIPYKQTGGGSSRMAAGQGVMYSVTSYENYYRSRYCFSVRHPFSDLHFRNLESIASMVLYVSAGR